MMIFISFVDYKFITKYYWLWYAIGNIFLLYTSDEAVYNYGNNVLENLKERFEAIDEVAEYNQLKVIAAMQKNRVAEMHLSGTSGYGYNDEGRDTLERVYADIFKTEDALVRPQIICGTHALNVAISSNLRPGDELDVYKRQDL